jgi:CheY-like chemotaxis protein
MVRRGCVLVIDDMAAWRDILTRSLPAAEFEVESAATLEEAIDKLRTSFYHLLVVDMALVNKDINNRQGLALLDRLAREGLLNHAFSFIVVSAHAKDTMRTAFARYEALDYLPKAGNEESDIVGFDVAEYLTSVREAFDRKLKVNLKLRVSWQQGSGNFDRAVEGIQVVDRPLAGDVSEQDVPRLKVTGGTSQHELMKAEFEDLLCRLFYQADEVSLLSLARGFSGSGVLWAQPLYGLYGAGRVEIIKYGDLRKIQTEHANFNLYVEPYLRNARFTQAGKVRYTTHLGGIGYSLVGSSGEPFDNFGDFYRSEAKPATICELLDDLFYQTCDGWYSNPGLERSLDLTAEYQTMLGLKAIELGELLNNFAPSTVVEGGRMIRFADLQDSRREFTNPVVLADTPLNAITYSSLTHGDLHNRNILVDSDRHAWLIDFMRTGPGHILRDVTQLDNVIRMQLLDRAEATLDERLSMEQVLLTADEYRDLQDLAGQLQTSNKALRKAFEVVLHLRMTAKELLPVGRQSMREYYIGLFYHALGDFRHSDVHQEHALLAASLLADKLELTRVE